MTPLRMNCVAVFLLVFGAISAMAEPEKISLPHVDHAEAALAVIGEDGQITVYSPAQLEEFPTYQIETTTPWRERSAVFSGVLLSDVLAQHGLQYVPALLVTAENEYAVTFDRGALMAAPILIATRVNGVPHSRRARGPIQFIIADTDMRTSDALHEGHLVWMAARIEASN